MLGFTEVGTCQLLEHHWIDETKLFPLLQLTLLPYLREHNTLGKGLMEFPTESEAKEFVEVQIHEWIKHHRENKKHQGC